MLFAALDAWLSGGAALLDCYSIADIRERARRRIPRFAFDYVDGGAEDEVALARSQAVWSANPLIPRVGRDLALRDLSMELFGHRWAAPFGVAPTGLAGVAWPGADLMIARAAAAANLPVIVSSGAGASIEGCRCRARRACLVSALRSCRRRNRVRPDAPRRSCRCAGSGGHRGYPGSGETRAGFAPWLCPAVSPRATHGVGLRHASPLVASNPASWLP
jgi:hypothetical protein